MVQYYISNIIVAHTHLHIHTLPLQSRNTERISLQLIAATSLFLSAKYDVSDMCMLSCVTCVCHHGYSHVESIAMLYTCMSLLFRHLLTITRVIVTWSHE